MCQATVYLNDEVIMRDVMIVEPVPDGIRLIALFEPIQVVPAAIRQIDLIKHRVILEPLKDGHVEDEPDGKVEAEK
jgi:predicted RNA-binding protein